MATVLLKSSDLIASKAAFDKVPYHGLLETLNSIGISIIEWFNHGLTVTLPTTSRTRWTVLLHHKNYLWSSTGVHYTVTLLKMVCNLTFKYKQSNCLTHWYRTSVTMTPYPGSQLLLYTRMTYCFIILRPLSSVSQLCKWIHLLTRELWSPKTWSGRRTCRKFAPRLT